MKLSRLYKRIVEFGRDRDPRKGRILSYEDTAVLYGKPETEIRRVLIGIDIEVPELLLADKIREKDGLDLVIAHHPEGGAFASLYKVMQLQVDLLKSVGVKEALAQEMLDERMREVERRLLSGNHMRPVDAARLMDLPFMCVHTPADNHVYHYLKALLGREKPKRVGDIIKILMEIPEYREACFCNAGPRILTGNPSRQTGKILVEMTGGTEGSREVFDKLYKAGVRTLVCMHLSEEHFKKVKDASLNVVIAGHISSDTLGLNLLMDRIEKEERLEFIDCSGFRRVRRN
jgi:putative NIF3 family GTP cyclohydrolase 1 type 2